MTLDDVICKLEITDMIYEHQRLLDNHQFEESRGIYTPDAVMVANGGVEIRFADMSLETMKGQSSNYKPRLITSVVVSPTGPNTAKAVCYSTLRRDLCPNAEQHYDFVKTDKGWKCRRMKIDILERFEGELAKLQAEAAAKAKEKKM